MSTLIQCFFSLLFLVVGIFFSSLAFLPLFCRMLAKEFLRHPWLFLLGGSILFVLGALLLYIWIYRLRCRSIRIWNHPHPLDIEYKFFNQLILKELDELFPDFCLRVDIRPMNKERLDVQIFIPSQTPQDREAFVQKANQKIREVFNKQGFMHSFRLSVLSS